MNPGLTRAAATAAATAATAAAATAAATTTAIATAAATAAATATATAEERLAASDLQRFYSRRLALQVSRRGVTVASANAMPFEGLSKLLRNTVVIKSMKLLLHRICVLTTAGTRFMPPGAETKNVNVRVFLAAFLMTSYPDNVFESVNQLETELIMCAHEMLAIFEALSTALRAPATAEAHRVAVHTALGFPLALHNYLKAFQAWKLPDEKKLTDRIAHALEALYAAEDQLGKQDTNGNGGAPVDEAALRAEFRGQQQRLRQKLTQIAGEKAVQVVSFAHTPLIPFAPSQPSTLGMETPSTLNPQP